MARAGGVEGDGVGAGRSSRRRPCLRAQRPRRLPRRQGRRPDEIAFVGIDGLPQEGQAYVCQGLLAASFAYPTGGAEAIESALKILHGESVPKEITLASRAFTPANVGRGGEALK